MAVPLGTERALYDFRCEERAAFGRVRGFESFADRARQRV